MVKHYLLPLTLIGMSCLCAGAIDVPYVSAIGDKSLKGVAADWTVVDANNDKTAWEYDSTDDNMTAVTGFNAGIKYRYNSNNRADDWAFSPGFELKGGTEYVISYWAKESKAGKESMNVYIGNSLQPEDYGNLTPVREYPKNLGATWRNEKVTFTPDADGMYHVAFHVISDANQWGLFLRGFSIKENILCPAAPSGLQVTPAADKSLSATLSWVLPETDDEDNPLVTPLTGVNVRRNGELIATLDGDAVEYVDQEVPEAGVYEYAVSALIGRAESYSCSQMSSWIGMKTPQVLPYSENFKTPDFFKTFWTCIDVAGDAKPNSNSSYPPLSNAWCFQSNMMGNAWWAVIHSSRNAEVADDDWLVSAPLAFPAAGKYKVSFKLSMYAGAQYGCLIGVYAGTGDTPEAMEIPVGEVTQVESTQLDPNTGGTPFEFEFEVSGAGVYYIGFHSTNPASVMERRLQLGAFAVEVVELYGDKVLVPPYDSASDEDWNDTDRLAFALAKGYYHASWATGGEVGVDSEAVSLDSDFSEDYAVVKVEESCEAAFSAVEPFTSFSIIPFDHTPAGVGECVYSHDEDGILVFTFKAPSINVSGSALYEISGVRMYADGELIAESDECVPGMETRVAVTNPVLRSGDPVYTVALHNLSGEGEAVVAEKAVVSSIDNLFVRGESKASRIFRLDGVEVTNSGALAPGVYIEFKDDVARKIIVR